MIQSYKDLCTEIEIEEIFLRRLEAQKNKLIKSFSGEPSGYKAIEYSDMPKLRGIRLPLDQGIEQLQKLEPKILELQRKLNGKRKMRDKVDELLNKLDGDDYKVMYKRMIEDKPRQAIADEMFLSVPTIDRIIARNKGDK